jgi:tRNA A58 N-methylase Trm61
MPPKGFENRFLTIYFPTAEEVNDIKDAAEKAGLHHAHFMREMIRKGMEFSQEPDLSPLNRITER